MNEIGKRAVEFISSHDPFGDRFSEYDLRSIETAHGRSFHRYGDNEPIPDRARIADSVSVVRCSCGKVCIRFHHPATTTNPGRAFAAAFLDAKDCANIAEDALKALDACRHNIICDGRH